MPASSDPELLMTLSRVAPLVTPTATMSAKTHVVATGKPHQSLVRIEGLEKTYTTKDGGAIHALKDVRLDIGEGEFISIVGPSGCGKTTLLKILAGILERSSGAVTMRGK